MAEIVNQTVNATTFSNTSGTGGHSNHFKLNRTTPISVIFSSFSISRGSVVNKCLLYFKIPSEIVDPYRIKISYRSQNTSNDIEDIDVGDYKEISSSEKYLVFDISDAFPRVHKSSMTFELELITNDQNDNSVYYFEKTPVPYLDISYNRPFAFLENQKVLKDDIGEDMSYSINLNSGLLTFKKRLFNDVLPYPLELTYDDYSNSRYHNLPYRFKLSILERINFLNNNPKTYVDGEYKYYSLKKTSKSGIYYFDEYGSGLILEPLSNGNYKLFVDSNNGYKLFNSDGYLIKIVDEFGREINIAYTQPFSKNHGENDETIEEDETRLPSFYTITITDYLGFSVVIEEKPLNGTITIKDSSSNILQTINYTSPSSKLTIIKESNDTKETTISYDTNNGRLSSINEYSLYSVLFGYDDVMEKPISVTHKYNGQTLKTYSFDYGSMRTDVTDNHGVRMRYLFDEKERLVTSGEVKDNQVHFASFNSYDEFNKYSASLDKMRGISFKTNQIPQQGVNTFNLNIYSYSYDYGFILKGGKYYLLLLQISKDYDELLRYKTNVPTVTMTCGGITTTLECRSNERNGVALTRFYLASDHDMSSANPGLTMSISFFQDGNINHHFGFSVKIIECKGYMSDYYLGLNNSEPSLNKPSFFSTVINGQYYHSLTFKDLTANYYNKNRGKPFFWDNDKHTLVYAPTYPSEYLYCDGVLGALIAIFADTLSTVTLDAIVNHFSSVQRCDIDSTLFGVKTVVKYVTDYTAQLGYYPIVRLYYIRLFTDYALIYNKTFTKNNTYLKTSKYDYYSRLLKTVDENDNFVEYTYDNYDNVLSKKEGKEQYSNYIEVTNAYDSLYRMTSMSTTIDNIIQTSSLQYTSFFRTPSSSTNANNVTKYYSFDLDHRNITSVSCGNSSIDSDYTYSNLDTVSNDSEINLPRDSKNLSSGYNVLFGNNQYKQVLTVTNTVGGVSDSVSEQYLNKLLVRYGNNKYQQIRYIFELVPLSKLIRPKVALFYFDERPENIEDLTINDSDNPSLTSQLFKIIDTYSEQSTCFTYDDYDRVSYIAVRDNNTELITYTQLQQYDSFNRLTNVRYSNFGKTVETLISYASEMGDTISEITQRVYFTTTNYSFISEESTLDPLKRISNLNQIDNGEYELNKDYNYHSSNNKTSVYPYRIDYSYTDNNNTSILQKSYYITYNALANITSIKEGNTSSPTPLTGSDYVYDNLNQLTEEINYQSNIESRLVYSYDNNGNITSVNKYDLNNNLISSDTYSYHSYYKDLLISFNNNSITYDDALNPISYNGMTFAYSNRNKLISFTKNNVTYNYKYNYNGIRTEKTVDNILKVKYVLDGNRIIKEERQDLVNNTNINLIYLYGQQGLMGIIKDETLYRVITNVLGDITYIYQGDTLLAHYVYDAYGNHKVLDSNNNEITNPTHIGLLNPFRYRGYYFDQESGLYYCNARYYYPVWRRWLTPDHYSYLDNKSLIGINLFAYCKNNPVMLYDPEGNSSLLVGIIIIVAFSILFLHSDTKHKYENYYDKGYMGHEKITLSTGNDIYYYISDVEDHNGIKRKNLKIFNSYYYSEKEIDELLDYLIRDGYEINIKIVKNEWEWHKIAFEYGIDQRNTASVDSYFDAYDDTHGFWSWFMKTFRWF
ncbi:MAG: RHS repeat-associated core domain-containing protein [Bacilli bacterium]|nr:RHS repeat-associated core domain-containing protein [Bacilli bacterium]